MDRNYNIRHVLIAYILVWSLCLQGCNRLSPVSVPDAKIAGAGVQERTNLSEGGQPKDTPSDTIVHQRLPGRMLSRAELLKALEEEQEAFHNQIVQSTEAKEDSEQQEKEQEGNEKQENRQNASLEGFVRLMGIGNHLITQNKAYEILSLNAYQDECKKNEKGNHPVVRIGDVYFKANRGLGGAITPGMEQAMYLLQNLLVGQGITPSALLSLSDVLLYQENADMPVDLGLIRAINEQKRAIFFEKNPAFKQYLTLEKTNHLVQVTQSVKGDSFAAFLDQVRQHKRSFDEIDNASLSAHLLTSFVVNYYDAHGDNLMVTPSGSIVGIDNDMALAYPLIHFFSYPSRCSEHYVGARNIFYCIAELMRRPIDETIRQRILSLSAEELILTWLGLLEKTNMNYQRLQAQGAFQAEEATELGLPIKLAPKIGSFLLGRLNRIKTYLTDYPDLTHIRLLTLLDPLVGLHYQTLWERFQDPLEVAVRIFPGSTNQVVSLEQTLNMRTRLNDGRFVFKALREERSTRQAHKNHIQTPTQEAQSLLQTIDLKTHLSAIQSHILQCAGEYFPQALSQHAHASWKDPYLIEKVMAGELDEAVMGTLGLLGITLPAETRSLLHEAIQKSHSLKLIGELIRQGCSVNQRHGRATPLELAMERDNREVVTFLIEQGAKEVPWRIALAYVGRLEGADAIHQKVFQKLEDTNPEISWRRTIDVLLPTTGAGITIQTATMGERVLPKANYDQLFDRKGNIKRVNKNGRRNVGRIEQGHYCLYVKEYPELPGMEEAVRLLMRSIVGHGVPYGGIIRVGSKPYYISQGVPGETLQEVLEQYPKRLQHLDSQRLSEMIIGSMLNNPEDGNPTNYIVKQLPSGLYAIEGVDNDHAFGETVAREKQGIATQVKCILFCLDQMQEKVHPKAMETFKNFNPAHMLEWWLTELSSLNTCYGKLFKPAETKTLMTKSGSFMGVAFTPKMLSRLYEKMVRLQRFLHKANESVTHLQLLNHMEPLLYKKYKEGFETQWDPGKGAAPWQRFLKIDGPFYGRTKGGALLTSTSLKQFLTSLDIPIKEEILDVIRAGGHIGPNMALMELQEMIQQVSQEVTSKGIETFKALKTHEQRDKFLKQLDFKSMPFTDQQAWITALKSFEDHRVLRVQNCVVLSNKDFERGGFYISNLRKLDLDGSENLEENIFPLLATEAVGLTHLNLKGLKKVTRIEGKINKQGFIRQTVTKEPLVFQNLQWINISQYLVLTSIAFEAPHLTYLKAKGCTKLAQLAIQAPLLKSLDIRKATLLTDEVFDRQLSNWSVLKNLRLKGCKKISRHDIRQMFPLYPVAMLQGLQEEFINETLLPLLQGSLTKLNLSHSRIGSGAAQALAKALEHNSTLTALDLSSNQLGPEGGIKLAESLPASQVHTLYLSSNQLGPEGGIKLAESLPASQVHTLYLSYNQLGPEGGIKLAESLPASQVHTLDLRDNHLGPEVGIKLAESLPSSHVHTLYLWGNSIGYDLEKAIEQTLERNKKIHQARSSSPPSSLPDTSKTATPPTLRQALVYHTLFESQPVSLQKGPALLQISFVDLVGQDLEILLDRLFQQQDQTILLCAPIFQACFKSRYLPPSLQEHTQELCQLWKKSQKNLLILANNPDSPEFQKVFHAHQELDKALQDYAEDLAVLKIFIPWYLQQSGWLKQEMLPFLSNLGERLGIQFQFWKSSATTLTQDETMGSRDSESIIHLLKDRATFYHLLPINHSYTGKKVQIEGDFNQGKGKEKVKNKEKEEITKQQKGKGKEKEEITKQEKDKEKEKQEEGTPIYDDLPPLEVDYFEDTDVYPGVENSEAQDFSDSNEEVASYYETSYYEKRLANISLPKAEDFRAELETETSIRHLPESDYAYVGLSIDGGGIRGKIPILLMSMLEEASKKKIHELVDYIGGTSIGGICALGFVATEDHDRPLWQVKDLVELFDEHGTSIFPTSRGIKKVYTRVAQLWNVKYSPKPLERVLRQYFGNLNLSDTLIPALATAMKIPETETYTFESEKAQVNEHDDYLMTDVMRATSAAPTYFPGHTFSNIVGGPSSTFVDGGIWINNPTELVYKRIIKLYEHSSQKADQTNVLMVSLGTGSNPLKSPLAKQVGLLQAVAPTIESLMAANSHGVHQEMERLLGNNYCRLQPSLATVIDLADASTEALQALEDAAHSLRPHIEAVARRLAENKDRKHPGSL